MDMTDRHEAFGTLRSLMEQEGKYNRWLDEVLDVLGPVAEAHPQAYRDEWLPYLESHDALWRRRPKYVGMSGGAQPVPFAPFLYYRTELYDHSNLEPLEDFPRLDRMVYLTMSDFREEECYVNWDWFAQLPWDALRGLNLLNLGLSVRDARNLFDMPTFVALESLSLGGNWMGPEGAKALANCGLENLRELRVDVCKLGDTGAEALAASFVLSSVTKLEIGSNGLTDAGVQALASSPHLGNLQELDIGYNDFGVDGLEALASSTSLGSLRVLHVGRYPKWGDDAKPALDRLRARCERVWA